ncbi:MAG: hypothetical protein Q8L74_13035 [Nitrospirota bacterium]|nr:hypothetical protein [Nitrospirota bacterium]
MNRLFLSTLGIMLVSLSVLVGSVVPDALARGGGGRGGGYRGGGGHSGGHQSVRPYNRKDGTHVQPHHRTAPNSTQRDNFSSKGNVNPYTGKAGTKEPAR